MATIIDIHGYANSAESLWHPWLKEFFEHRGDTVITPSFPGRKYPVYTEWEPVIEQALAQSNGSVTMIGHSLGTRALIRYLEEHECTIDRGVLIAPFANLTQNADYRDGAYANFFSRSLDMDQVKSSADEWIVIGSLDDSRIPFEQASEISMQLEAQLIAIPDSDHFLDPKWGEVLCSKLI